MPKNNFNKNLKYLRETNKLEQQELADKLGIPRSTLSCWETKKRTPKIEQIIDIANFFGISLNEIVCTELYKKNIEEKKK